MAATSRSGKKWINASVAIVAIVLGYVVLSFIRQLGEWFELEAKIAHFTLISQITAVLIGLTAFIIVLSHKKSSSFLQETFGELLKVVWPDKNETVKHTISILILVTIVGFILGLFDFLAGKFLTLLR